MTETQLKAFRESTSKKLSSIKVGNSLEKVSPSIEGIRDAKNAIVSTKIPIKRAESLARLGRAYGNNISKLNVLKPSPIHQSAHELREPWHSSSKTESREYGDYYSWQSSLSYLETNRSKVILYKGMKQFIDEYMRKLLRCQIFERGHNVEPFATARLDLVNKGKIAKSSKLEVVYESRDSFRSNGIRKNVKNKVTNVPISALKTIELIRKYKNGESIEDDLQATDKNVVSPGNDKLFVGQEVNKSGSTTSRNRSLSTQNQKITTKKDENSDKSDVTGNVYGSKFESTTNRSSSMQNQKVLKKQNENATSKYRTGNGKLRSTSETKNEKVSTTTTEELGRRFVIEQNENSIKKQVIGNANSSKSGSTTKHSSTTENRKDSAKQAEELDTRFVIVDNPKDIEQSPQTRNTTKHSSTTENVKVSTKQTEELDNSKDTERMPEALDENSSYAPVILDIGQNFLKNLEERKLDSSTKQSSLLYRNDYLRQSDNNANLFDDSSVESLRSSGSFNKEKYVESVKALRPNTGIRSLRILRRKSK